MEFAEKHLGGLVIAAIIGIAGIVASDNSNENGAVIIPIDKDSFEEKVLQSNDSWILVFHRGEIADSWVDLARSIRGLAWVGELNIAKIDQGFIKSLKLNPSKSPTGRVYPHGRRQQKLSQWQDVATPREAERFALKTLPTDLPHITSGDIDKFILDSHESDTPRFPTIYLTDSEDISPVFRALKVRFYRYFKIGIFLNPTPANLVKLGFEQNQLPKLPALVIILREEQRVKGPKEKPKKLRKITKEDMKKKERKPVYIRRPIQYNEDSFGSYSYASIMQFFFSVNHQFRYTLPDGRFTDQKTVAMMDDVMKIEEDRFDELFGRRHVSKLQADQTAESAKAEDNGTSDQSEASGRPEGASAGGKCPFGYDRLPKNAEQGKRNKEANVGIKEEL